MADDKVEILKSGYRAFSETYIEQLNTQQYLNEKSVDFVKIVILIAALIASIASFADIYIAIVYLVGGSVLLVTSAVFLMNVISPSKTYYAGIGENAKEQMLNEDDLENHYRNLLTTYSKSVREFDEQYYVEKAYFENALESVTLAIFIHLIGATKLLIVNETGVDYPITYDVIFTFLIIVAFGLRLYRRLTDD